MKKILLVLLAIVSFVSCECEKVALDGDWEKMKWEKHSYTTEKFGDQSFIKVPKEGGTYTFKCKNYPGFWLSSLLVVDMGYGTNVEKWYEPMEKDPHKLECEAATVTAEGPLLTIAIAPISEHNTRQIHLNVTAGDIFDDFQFLQW